MVHKRKRAVQTSTTENSVEVGTPSYSPIHVKVTHTTKNELARAIMASGPRKKPRRRHSFLYP